MSLSGLSTRTGSEARSLPWAEWRDVPDRDDLWFGTDARDSQLLRLRTGDERGLETLMRTYGGRLLALARRMLTNEEDARDAVQEAFLSAIRSIESFDGRSQLATWLGRIVINACLMRLRARSRHAEESIDALLPRFDVHGRFSQVISNGPLPHELAESKEARRHVRDAIDRLPQTHRTVLVLRDLEGLDNQRTADLLCISPNAAKVRLHRARQALRTLLVGRYG